MLGFERRASSSVGIRASILGLTDHLTDDQAKRYERYRECFNFFEGYHWEDLPDTDSPQVTVNYCRSFVNKFVAFELGKAFTYAVSKKMAGTSDTDAPKVTADGKTLFQYIEEVWENNSQYLFCTEMGQMKSITGDSWVQVSFDDPSKSDYFDPYNEYPEGRVVLDIIPTSLVFPEYDAQNHNHLVKLTIQYMFKRPVVKGVFSKETIENTLFKQVWTAKTVVTKIGSDPEVQHDNKYGIIPIIQIKNLPIAGKNDGLSDLEDLIPMNTEYNLKKANVSEILDYHAAPITLVYGAKIGNLEKGANKLWGGLPKDARVENLELQGSLQSSTEYEKDLKLSMCEVAGVPEASLGGSQAISNTSGVALEYMNLPLVEKVRMKRMCTEDGLERLNKLILLVSVLEGLIKKPEEVSNRDFYFTEVTVNDTLPKDILIELQAIQQEMSLALEDREGAMKRLGKEDIPTKIAKIDKDRKEHPEAYNIAPAMQGENPSINSGLMNGSTVIEQVRKEMTGKNG